MLRSLALQLSHTTKKPCHPKMYRIPYRTFWGDNRQRKTPEEFDVNIDYYKILGLPKTAS
jgi:hypothetical protein